MKKRAVFMQDGKGRSQKRHYLLVNDKGYVSLYALAIFMIILSFLTYCVLYLKTTIQLIQSKDLFASEILAIHHAKNHVQGIEEKEKTDASQLEETISYKHIALHFTYQKDQTIVRFMCRDRSYTIQIAFNEKHEIEKVAYS